MEIEDFVPEEEELRKNVKFRSGLISRKNIALTGEKLIEFGDGIFTQSYEVVDRDKIVSTKLDYGIPKKPFIAGLLLLAAAYMFHTMDQFQAQVPEILGGAGSLAILYGVFGIRKKHIVRTVNPDVNIVLPRRKKSTEILNQLTEKL